MVKATKLRTTTTVVAECPRYNLNAIEAARAIGVSRAMLYRLLAAETIKSFHIGRRRLISISAIESYLASQGAESGAA